MAFGIGNVRWGGSVVPAVRIDDHAYLLLELVPDAPRSFSELLPEWDSWVERIGASIEQSAVAARPVAELEWVQPGIGRPNIYCAGANYRDHVDEMGYTQAVPPFHFVLTPEALAGPGTTISIPDGMSKLDWEVELACIIARTARDIDESEALSYVAAYTIANDVSVRDDAIRSPLFGIDWLVAKNTPGHTPLGPVAVPALFVGDVNDLALSMTVNGEVRQSSNTSQMLHSTAAQIARLSRLVTLEAGDVILTGTPAGTAAAYGAYLTSGDVMVARVDGLGELSTRVA